jgi:predicted nucleic acid-binding Zn ribbon protein
MVEQMPDTLYKCDKCGMTFSTVDDLEGPLQK